jgi:hypothetical protein
MAQRRPCYTPLGRGALSNRAPSPVMGFLHLIWGGSITRSEGRNKGRQGRYVNLVLVSGASSIKTGQTGARCCPTPGIVTGSHDPSKDNRNGQPLDGLPVNDA